MESSSGLSRKLAVFYASQTGTAQEFAERFARQARRRGYGASVQPLSEACIPHLPRTRYAVFFVSTTGDGEMPDHARPWWRFLLRRDLPATSLSQLRFAVFGLGDSSYVRFCAAARKVAARLPQLGAVPLCERGLGDEQREPGGLDAGFDAWTAASVWPALAAARADIERSAACVPGVDGPPPVLAAPRPIRCRYNVTVLDTVVSPGAISLATVTGESKCSAPGSVLPPLATEIPDSYASPLLSNSGPWPATVRCNERLTAPGWRQDVRRIELQLPPAVGHVPYRAGDVAVVYPRNEGTPAAEEAVAFFAKYIGLPLSTRLQIQRADAAAAAAVDGISVAASKSSVGAAAAGAATAISVESTADAGRAAGIALDEPDGPVHPFPAHPITLEQLLRCHLDIQGTPRRSALELMASYASDDEQRGKLLELSGFASDTATLRAAQRAAKALVGSASAGAATGGSKMDADDASGAGAVAGTGAGADAPAEAEEAGADADVPTAAEASGAYRLYVASEARTFAEVLADFPSVAMPLHALLELLPPLQPRHFSIASASCAPGAAGPADALAAADAVGAAASSDAAGCDAAAAGQHLELCVGLVQYATPLRRRKTGVCSGFLSSLPAGGTVYVGIRKGTFTPPWPLPPAQPVARERCGGSSGSGGGAGIPASPPAASGLVPDFKDRLAAGLSVPLVLVGPGTGIAPMRALWQERASAIRCLTALAGAPADTDPASGAAFSSGSDSAASMPAIAPCCLFYGCRNAQSDWLFGKEAALEAVPSGALTAYDAAFSRPVPASTGACAQAECGPEAAFEGLPASADTQPQPLSSSLSPPLASATCVCWPIAKGSKTQPHDVDTAGVGASSVPVAVRPPPVTYVQHRIAAPEHGRAVADALSRDRAIVFISGSAKRMPTDVAAALKDVLVSHGEMAASDAASLVSGMERTRRLITEAWS